MPWLEMRFVDAAGDPLALGTLSSFEAGTDTPLETYSDALLTVANPVVMQLGSDGCPTSPVYLLPQGYKFTVKDALGVIQPHYPFDNVLDVGQAFAFKFGVYQFAGAKDVVSGYTVDPAEDYTITVSSTGGASPAIINLPPASEFRWPLTIKNMGTEPVQITPDGTETIDGLAAALAIIPAAASPLFPAVTLLSDGISAFLVVSSHGIMGL
jgi:hypothetical protein